MNPLRLLLILATLPACAASPVYPPLQRQLNGVWQATDHAGELLEFRPGKPTTGTVFVWSAERLVDRKPYRIVAKDRITFAAHTYQVRIQDRTLMLSIPKGFPGSSTRARKYRSLSLPAPIKRQKARRQEPALRKGDSHAA